MIRPSQLVLGFVAAVIFLAVVGYKLRYNGRQPADVHRIDAAASEGHNAWQLNTPLAGAGSRSESQHLYSLPNQGAELESTRNLPSAGDCFALAGEPEFQSCIVDSIQGITLATEMASFMADAMCGQEISRQRRLAMASIALEHLAPRESIDFIRRLPDHCRSNRARGIIAQAMSDIAVEKPELYLQLREHLTVEEVFDNGGHASLIATIGVLARETQDLDLRSMIEAAALGQLGGESRAYGQAVVQSLASQENAQEFAQNVQDILNSPSRRLEEGREGLVGCHLISFVLRDGRPNELGSIDTIGMVLDILADEAWGPGGARQIVTYQERDAPPEGIDAASWAQVWDHAYVLVADSSDG